MWVSVHVCVCVCVCVCVNRVFLLWKEYKCKDVKTTLNKTGVPIEIRRRNLSNKVPSVTKSMSGLVDWHIDTNVSEEIDVWDRDRGFHWNVSNYVPKYTVSYSKRPLYSCTKQHASSLATPQLTSVLRVWSQVRRDRVCGGPNSVSVTLVSCASHLLKPPLRWTLCCWNSVWGPRSKTATDVGWKAT